LSPMRQTRRGPWVSLGLFALGLVGTGLSCRRAPPPEKEQVAPGSLPKEWTALGMPTRGLVSVGQNSDANGLFAEYKGYSDTEMFAAVEERFTAAGFKRTCTALDGRVRGYARDRLRYAMKIDGGGGEISLSIFNEKADIEKGGTEALLWGVCFAGLKLGPPVPIDAAELLHLESDAGH
jgi:hypothetical protein